MALLHFDGFDHYGTNANNTVLNSAGYSADGSAEVKGVYEAVNPRTGLGQLHFNSYQGGIKKAVNCVGKCGGHFGMLWRALPQNQYWGYHFMSADMATQFLNILWQADGTVIVSSNPDPGVAGAILGILPAGTLNSFKVNVYQCWEAVYSPNTNGVAPYNGSFTLYLEGAPVLVINGLSISNVCGAHGIGAFRIIGSTPDCFVDDWIIWDSSGTQNNTPLGPRRVKTRQATGVGPNNNWLINGVAADAAAATNSTTPQTTPNIESDTVGDITDLTLPPTDAIVTSVSGVKLVAYMQKTTSGAATIKLGIEAGLTVVNSPDIAPGVGNFAYYESGFIETDPNTGKPFTIAAYNSLGMRVTRSN
jgi:hypothetical protein